MPDSWNIYGKTYDLSSFIHKHPGGKEILEYTKNQADITSLFESYHNFSDKVAIKESLSNYEINPSNTIYDKYDYTEYNELIDIIKEKTNLKARKDIKAPYFFYIQNTVVSILYILTFGTAISGYLNVYISSILASFAGLSWMSIMYSVMHDASHYSISVNPRVNTSISRIVNSFGMWNHTIWFFHHIYFHHSFTNQKEDADIYHYYPFSIKAIHSKKLLFGKYVSYVFPFAMFILPGFYVGQVISYGVGYIIKKVFTKKLPKDLTYVSPYEFALYLLKILLLVMCNKVVLFTYIISLNFWYHINIIGDHDTYETHVENHYSGKSFLRLQVCNSGNFFTNSWWWHHVFGGINYQIEHHLFPNVSHKHYKTIAPIVKEYCISKNIPYVEHQSMIELYKSFLKMIHYYSR
jgi:fatty acid desaturase